MRGGGAAWASPAILRDIRPGPPRRDAREQPEDQVAEVEPDDVAARGCHTRAAECRNGAHAQADGGSATVAVDA